MIDYTFFWGRESFTILLLYRGGGKNPVFNGVFI